MDDELGLIYYNYRHLNPLDGRWISRDIIDEIDNNNLYGFVRNRVTFGLDYLGKSEYRGYGCNGAMLPPSAYRSADPCWHCPQGSRTRSISESNFGCCEYRTKNQRSPYVPPTNGCGSKGGIVQPPNDFNMFSTTIDFLSACDAHDTCYGTCGSKKSDCDNAFLRDMKQACLDAMTGKGIDLGMLASCQGLAQIYYNAVSFLGYCAYENAQDESCEWKNCN